MIQFALLFGLGFLTAIFLVFLVAPAIHRRIVWFTEKRLRATMPLSAREVRAQKDMARALYAADNAKTEQALTKEREKSIALQLHQETLTRQAGQLSVENGQLHVQIDAMSVEAGDLRSSLRRKESDISQLKSSLRISEQSHLAKEADMDGFRKRIDRLMADADGMKIDLAAREAEIESLRLRYNGLRSERDALRNETEAVMARANEAEIRINQKEYRAKRLEDSLGREIASVADKQTLIERRLQEVVRLKEKLKTKHSGRNPRSATRTVAARIVSDVKSAAPNETSDAPAPRDVDGEIARMSEEARGRSIALSDKLLKSRSKKHDDALREEIAVIAANMVALTALKEGSRSPILSLLPPPSDDGKGERQNLADRSTDLMSGQPPT